jgi:Domain of unknown function (DUF4832)/Domain of unknown function (DUF4874)
MASLTKSVTMEIGLTEIDDLARQEGYRLEPLEPPVDPPEDEWVKLCDEKQNFTLAQTSTVRYGVEGRWVEMQLAAGGYFANNELFGSDPAEGILKQVQVKKSSGGIVDPPPDPDPEEPPLGDVQIITYQPNTGFVKNPFIGVSYPDVHRTDKIKPLATDRVYANSTVLHRIIVLNQYRDRSLDERILSSVEKDLQDAERAGLTLDLIFSFWHNDNDEPGMVAMSKGITDAPLHIILRILEQLKPLFHKHAHVISHVLVGLVGGWGEWNKPSYQLVDIAGVERDWLQARGLWGRFAGKEKANVEDQRTLLRAIEDAVPMSRKLSFRYAPLLKRILNVSGPATKEQALKNEGIGRYGFHDHYLFSGSFDGDGMNNPWTPNSCEGVPDSYNESRARNAVAEFEACKYSNMQPSFESELRRLGVLETLQKRIGYRYVLIQGKLPRRLESEKPFALELIVKNEGFASVYNPRPADIVLRNKNTGELKRVKVHDDIRYVFPDPKQTVTVRLGGQAPRLEPGAYDMLLHLKHDYAVVENRPEYSIQFANLNTWESMTGFNKLGTFTV